MLALLLACAPAPQDLPPDVVDDPPVESDSPIIDPPDTDVAPDDTDVPEPPPPVTPFPAATGRFVDITAALWATGAYVLPPEDEDYPAGFPGLGIPAWGDLDGDGAPELIVHGARRVEQPMYARLLLVFHVDAAGTFTEDPALAASLSDEQAHAVVALIDLDGDGDDDVLRSSLRMGLIELVDGPSRRWADITLPDGVVVPHGQRQPALADLDHDGWLDVLVGANGCSAGPRLYAVLRTHVDRWEARADLLPDGRDTRPYALLVADLAGERDLVATLGDSCQRGAGNPGFLRLATPLPNGLPTWAPFDPIPADAWFRQTPSGFSEYVTGKQPMGGAVLDLDGDGRLDLALTPSDDHLYLFRDPGGAPLDDVTLTAPAPLERGPSGDPKLPWGVVAEDLDLDGWTDLVVGRGDDNRMITEGAPYNGPYQPSALYNAAGAGFVEGRQVFGLDTFDGETQSVVAEDIDGDLDRDLIVGGSNLFPRVLRNDVVPAGRRLALRLRGTTSNHLAIGAIVQVEVPGLPLQTRRVGHEATEHGVSDPLVVLAGGAGPTVPRVTITWPTGVVQVLTDLAVDTLHTLDEPPTITLSEADRHLPADGVARLVVTVTPRDAAGAPDPTAAVTVDQPTGAATWDGPAVRDGATWTRALLAPAAPGSSQIAVTVNGAPLRVLPRVWWD
jgi:hypothetical protein